MPYWLPPEASERLEALVDRIEANPGNLIDPREFEELELDPARVLASLPTGMSADDLAGVLKLAMLTECATDTYAREISSRARLSGAGWLERFNERVWRPDELTHAEPFRLILLQLGFSEAELDREIAETQEKEFEHTGGDSPIHVSTFGMVQEYLTDHWHGMIARLLRDACPLAAAMANRIKKRETLHTIWYRDMTALQVEASPELVLAVSEELDRFRLPGNSLIPELQSRAQDWLVLMGADFGRVVRDLVRLLETTVNSPSLLGRLVLDLAGRRGARAGPLTAAHVNLALERLGGRGYGLIGEAILERMGLAFLYQKQELGDGLTLSQRGVLRVRALLRAWLAARLPMPAFAGGS